MDKYYHFTKYENLEQVSEVGLIPQIGDRSISVDDNKKAVFLSKEKISAILMFFAMNWFYYSHTGVAGENLLSSAIESVRRFENKLEKKQNKGIFSMFGRSTEELQKLCDEALATKNQVENMKKYSSFEEYWGTGVYLCVTNVPDIKYNHPDFHNCWVERNVEPQDINVVLLRNKETGEMIDEKRKVIDYFMATTPLSDLFSEYKNTIGINDDRYAVQEALKDFNEYYSSHEEEFKELDSSYDLIEMPIKDYMNTKKDVSKNM